MKKLLVIGLIIGAFQYWVRAGDPVLVAPTPGAPADGVVLYATEWCGYCQKARELFKNHSIPYIEHDIEKSERGYREYKSLGGQGIPVVNAYGRVIHGYSQRMILAAVRAGEGAPSR